METIYKLLGFKLFDCFLCQKMKPQFLFGTCSNKHVERVRKAPINFTCKKCVRKRKM